MYRQFIDNRLVIASHNSGKIIELEQLLASWPITPISAQSLNLPEPEETGLTFSANAKLKSDASAKVANLPAIADDSGLVVEALGGKPGIYSARWAGKDKNFFNAMARIHSEIGKDPNRNAKFVCALALSWPDGHCEIFEGTVSGRLVWPPRGNNGFGYDPMFVPDDSSKTFGECKPTEKYLRSHRILAFNKLVSACFTELYLNARPSLER
tara:strand:- start:27 stop:659 length:633 start_codon:yes stop_codon:yes gene_type:complete